MKLGIIGGSGLDDINLIKDEQSLNVETPYGSPSSLITSGIITGLEVCILSRHGKKHEISPTNVNNRANIFALKKLGCTHIIATTAVGSLREEIRRGHFVVLSDFIDFTKQRKMTFFDSFENGIKHTAMAEPFSDFLRKKIIESGKEMQIIIHEKGVVLTIEGPRFSTRAESMLFRQWGADVINMSIAPEAILAKEMGIEYAVIAMSTDYDCWKRDEKPVSWEDVLRIFEDNAEKMKLLLLKIISKLSSEYRAEKEAEFIKSKIRTIPNWPKQGIMFRDITTLLKDKEGFMKVIKIFEERYRGKDIDLIAGIESRGFLVASALASRLEKGMVLIRKAGKLPAETIKEEYSLEYGKDSIEIHKDAINLGNKVLLVDDLLATGGTMKGASDLIRKSGGDVVECAFIIELFDLGGRKKLEDAGNKVYSVVGFEGE